MKRNHVLTSLAFAALLTSAPVSGLAQQQSETASTDIYDFSKLVEKGWHLRRAAICALACGQAKAY